MIQAHTVIEVSYNNNINDARFFNISFTAEPAQAYNLSKIGEKVSKKDIIEKAIEFVKPYSLYDEHKVYTDNKAKMYMVVLSHANSLDGEVILFYTFDGI